MFQFIFDTLKLISLIIIIGAMLTAIPILGTILAFLALLMLFYFLYQDFRLYKEEKEEDDD